MKRTVFVSILASALVSSGLSALMTFLIFARAISSQLPEELADRVIKVAGLELVGAEGSTLASLAVSPDGSPSLVLRGKDGEDRAWLRIEPDGTIVQGYGAREGTPAIELKVTADGAPQIVIRPNDYRDQNGTLILGTAGHDTTLGLRLLDDQAKSRARLVTYSSGEAVFELGEQGVGRLQLHLPSDRNGSPHVFFVGKDGRHRITVGFHSRADSPTFSFSGNEGGRVEIAITDDGIPHVTLVDKNGTWTAPNR